VSELGDARRPLAKEGDDPRPYVARERPKPFRLGDDEDVVRVIVGEV
jgi:hypothetical protein